MPLDQPGLTLAMIDVATRDARSLANTLKQIHLRAKAGHPPSAQQLQALSPTFARLGATINRLHTDADHEQLAALNRLVQPRT